MTASCYSGWLTLSMCKYIAFGCTTALGSASFAVADISTAFEDLACNHVMDIVMNKIYFYYLNIY